MENKAKQKQNKLNHRAHHITSDDRYGNLVTTYYYDDRIKLKDKSYKMHATHDSNISIEIIRSRLMCIFVCNYANLGRNSNIRRYRICMVQMVKLIKE